MSDMAARILAGLPTLGENGAEPATDLFTRYTAKELVAMPRHFEWLARRLLVVPTYGQIAGEMKTLKTYINLMVALGVASGRTILDTFPVVTPGPVLMYVGEGGRAPITRRLERVAKAMGVELDNCPIHATFDVAPVLSSVFAESLRRDLEQVRPALMSLDPLYAYHGAETRAADLHAEGGLLSSLSAPCIEAGASLLVVNHFNQTGTGGGLKRITMAGSGEWSDSWILLSHRETPKVEEGSFRLLMEVGSRQWGGMSWDVDLEVGRFDADTGEYDGDIAWEVRRHHAGDGEAGGDRAEEMILDVLRDHPWELTKTQVMEKVGGNKNERWAAFERLERAKRVQFEALSRPEGGATRTRELWATSDQLLPEGVRVGTGWGSKGA